MNNSLKLSEVVGKHYSTLQGIINDLSSKCLGGEEVTVNFPSGKIIIKLK